KKTTELRRRTLLDSMGRGRSLGIAASLAALTCLCTAAGHFTTKGAAKTPVSSTGARLRPEKSHSSPQRAGSDQAVFIRKGSLWPQLRQTLRVLGDRLEGPGKERVTMSGTLTGFNSESLHPFRLITQFPAQVRLEEDINGGTVSTLFNGHDAAKGGGTVGRRDEDAIESLVFDSTEHFFIGQIEGFATRELGERFRLDDGRSENYTQGFSDIYQVTDRVGIGASSREQPKLFYINSDTLLLERVRYQRDTTTLVEVQSTGWTPVSGQMFPTSISRSENGHVVMRFAITSISFGPGVNDGKFDKP